jgi:hypothetical protein
VVQEDRRGRRKKLTDALLWYMEQGQFAKEIIERCISEGRPIPDNVVPPDLDDGLLMYWQAFTELDSCRPASMSGVPRIPWTAIRAYAQWLGLGAEEEDRFFFLIRSMDDVTVEHHARKLRTRDGKGGGWAPKGGSGKGPGRPRGGARGPRRPNAPRKRPGVQ